MADDSTTTDAPDGDEEQVHKENGEAEEAAPRDLDPEDEAVDPELMELPRQRRRRHPLIAVVVIALGLYLLWFLREDLSYYFQPRKPTDLGDVADAIKKGKLRHNTHVTLHGAPDRKYALILEGRSGYDSFFRLLRSDNRVFVQRHRETRSTDAEISSTHTGQLVYFDSLPHADNLREYFKKNISVAHDLPFEQVKRARGAGKDRVTLRDIRGRPVQLTRDSVIWINVAYPGEWVVQFRKQRYPGPDAAAAKMKEVALPHARDTEASDMYWRFVVHAEPDEVPLLLARFRDRSLGAGVVRRQLSYSARWNQLSVRDDVLELNASDPSFPSRFQKKDTAAEGEPPTLVPVKQQPVRIPKQAILYMETSSPLTADENAMVIVTGVKPGDKWFYLVLYAILGCFVLINLVSLLLRLRRAG